MAELREQVSELRGFAEQVTYTGEKVNYRSQYENVWYRKLDKEKS